MPGTLLQAGNAGEDPRGHALGRPADAARAPGAFPQACGGDPQGEARSPKGWLSFPA